MTFEGVTHDAIDPSVDILRTVTLPTIAKFCDIEEGLELKVIRRGAAPDGGGKVTCLSDLPYKHSLFTPGAFVCPSCASNPISKVDRRRNGQEDPRRRLLTQDLTSVHKQVHSTAHPPVSP